MSKPAWLTSRRRRLLLIGVAAVPLYLLSLGPAIVLHNRIPFTWLRSSIIFCYQPMDLLCDHTPFGPVVDAYADWWDALAPEIEMPEPNVTDASPPPRP